MANKKNRTVVQSATHVDILPESDEDILTLQDDEGNDVNFYEVACVELDNEFYVLLQPVEPTEGFADDEALICKIVEEDEENDLFVPVEDEELLDRIFNEYLKAVADNETGAQDAQTTEEV